MASLRIPVTLLLSLRCVAEPLPISVPGLQQKHWLGDAWGKTKDAAKNLRDKTSEAAQKAGEAVEEAKEKVGEAAGEAGRAAVDAAIKASGKCGTVWRGRKTIAPHFSVLVADAFQEYEKDPSQRSACMEVVESVVLDDLHKAWDEPTGLLDKITGGLSGEILGEVCGEHLMSTLKAQEPQRKSRPENYKAEVRETIRQRVLTDDWIEGKIEAHCGKQEETSRLFAMGAVWPQGGLQDASLLAVCSLGAALLVVAAGARWRRRATTFAAE